jgi:MarR family transcriptional regulator, organic hydroperoxide resistance regulator
MTATREPAPPGPEIGEAGTELGAAFKGLMGAFRRLRGRETRNPHGLSDSQYTLLFGLRGHEALASRELACIAGLSPGTAAEMLEGLAAAGLVRRVRSDKDRRVVLTSLTERGHALLEERHAQYAPRWNAAVAEFSDDELRTAARVLDRLRAVFDDIAREP